MALSRPSTRSTLDLLRVRPCSTFASSEHGQLVENEHGKLGVGQLGVGKLGRAEGKASTHHRPAKWGAGRGGERSREAMRATAWGWAANGAVERASETRDEDGADSRMARRRGWCCGVWRVDMHREKHRKKRGGGGRGLAARTRRRMKLECFCSSRALVRARTRLVSVFPVHNKGTGVLPRAQGRVGRGRGWAKLTGVRWACAHTNGRERETSPVMRVVQEEEEKGDGGKRRRVANRPSST